MSDNEGTGETCSTEQAADFKARLSGCVQAGDLFGTADEVSPSDRYACNLYQSIHDCNVEDSGYAIKKLIETDPGLIWKVILAADEDFTGGKHHEEIVALIHADNFVNKKLPPQKRDPLFQSKAIMILMYALCGMYDSILSTPYIPLNGHINHLEYYRSDIQKCCLPDGKIPEYVFDVHTIQGKRAGHTDWEMNLVENDALKPFQKAFFENGSWELRYDFKHRTGLCTEGEYLESLEYRKTHMSNPVKDICKHTPSSQYS